MFQGELDGGAAASVVATTSAGDVKASHAVFDVDVVAAAIAAAPSVVATTSVVAVFVVAC